MGKFLTLVFIYFVKLVLGGGGRYSGFTWTMVRDISCLGRRVVGRGGVGWGAHEFLRWWSKNFFNRSPITLKFEAGKIREREYRKRECESESERESKLLYLRSQVVVVLLVS